MQQGRLRNVSTSQLPDGGSADEFAALAGATMQVSQIFQQQALAAAKTAGQEDNTIKEAVENDENPRKDSTPETR